MALRKPDKKAVIISLLLFIGMFSMKRVYLMYASLITPFLIISIKNANKKEIYVAIILSVFMTTHYLITANTTYLPYDFINNISNEINNYNLPLVGGNFGNLLAYANNKEVVNSSKERGGIIDTTYSRLRHEQYYFKESLKNPHLFLCQDQGKNYGTACNIINKSDYQLIANYSEYNLTLFYSLRDILAHSIMSTKGLYS